MVTKEFVPFDPDKLHTVVLLDTETPVGPHEFVLDSGSQVILTMPEFL